MMSSSNIGLVTHQFPIWRERSDFIIHADLASTDKPRYEQLFVRRHTKTSSRSAASPSSFMTSPSGTSLVRPPGATSATSLMA
jgi:hypothetical protein